MKPKLLHFVVNLIVFIVAMEPTILFFELESLEVFEEIGYLASNFFNIAVRTNRYRITFQLSRLSTSLLHEKKNYR